MMSQLYDSAIRTSATWGEWAAKAGTNYDQELDYLTEMFPPESILGAPASTLGGRNVLAGQQTPRRIASGTALWCGNITGERKCRFSNPPQAATSELLPFLSHGQQVILSEFGHTGDLWATQPEATVRLLTSFYDTGVSDDSLYIYQPMDFHVEFGFLETAKQRLRILARPNKRREEALPLIGIS